MLLSKYVSTRVSGEVNCYRAHLTASIIISSRVFAVEELFKYSNEILQLLYRDRRWLSTTNLVCTSTADIEVLSSNAGNSRSRVIYTEVNDPIRSDAVFHQLPCLCRHRITRSVYLSGEDIRLP